MNELISQIIEKTGLSDEIAGQVVQIVTTFLQGKLPAGVGDQVASLLSGEGGDLASKAPDIVKGLGNLLGND